MSCKKWVIIWNGKFSYISLIVSIKLNSSWWYFKSRTASFLFFHIWYILCVHYGIQTKSRSKSGFRCERYTKRIFHSMIFELMLGDLFLESKLMQKCFWLLWEAHERIKILPIHPLTISCNTKYSSILKRRSVVCMKFRNNTDTKKRGKIGRNIKCWISFVKATRLEK